MDYQASERILLGSFEPPEFDIDNETENPEKYASDRYDVWSILENMNTDNFKSTYLLFIDKIKHQEFLHQKSFCIKIMSMIEEMYEYVPFKNPSMNNQIDLNHIYELLSFIEFDNVKFLASIWKFLRVDILKIDIEEYCQSNSNKIISEIDEYTEMVEHSWLINDFLRTYLKEKLIIFFIENTMKNKSEVIIKIIEGE